MVWLLWTLPYVWVYYYPCSYVHCVANHPDAGNGPTRSIHLAAMSILLRLIRFALKYKRRLLLAYLSTIGVAAFALTIPKVLGVAVDEVVGSGDLVNSCSLPR